MFSNPEKVLIQFGLSERMTVADFGAGIGFYAMRAAEKVGSDGKVYAIDIQKDLLSRLANEAEKAGLDNIETIYGDVEKQGNTSLADLSVDAVIIANTLFGMADKAGAAKEALRILKSKGRVLLVEWADSFAGIGPHRDHVVKKPIAKKIFTDVGFTFERFIESGEHHYGLVFRK